MARKQVIKPDFTINNINAVNNDPGARNFVGGAVHKPAQVVQKFDQPNSRGSRSHDDNLSVAKKTNLTALNFDGDNDYVQFSDHSDFSFIRTIEQNTINFTNNNANSKITVTDDSTLSMNKSEGTRVTNFVNGASDQDTVYSLADSGHTFSHVSEDIEAQTIEFTTGDAESYIEVNDADALSFSKQTELSALVFNGNGANKYVAMSADDDDFDMGDGSSDDPFCFAFWIYPTAFGTDYIFGKYEDTGTDTGYRCNLTSDGAIIFKIVGRDGATTLEINDFQSPQVSTNDILEGELDSWTHIAIRYTPDTSGTGANNDEEVQFFKDGVAWGSAVTTSNNDYVAMQNTNRPFTIGKFNPSSTNFGLFARLSNFLVFKHDGASGRSSTGLTDDQVGGLFNNGLVYDYNDHPKSADLIAWWKMNEDVSAQIALGGSGKITDYSGDNHHLNDIGSSMPNEESSSGLSEISATNFTISFWCKRDDAINSHRFVFYKTNEYQAYFYDNDLYFYVYDNYAPKGGTTTIDTRLFFFVVGTNTTDWQHVVLRFNASTKSAIANLNGGTNLAPSVFDNDSGFGEIHNTTNKLYIGSNSSNSTLGFDGQLSNFVMFNHDGFDRPGVLPDRGTTSLSDAEVYKLYDRDGTQGSASPLAGRPWDYNTHTKKNDIVAWWKLDETVGSATTINDSSAHEVPNNGVTKTTASPALTNPANSGLTSAIPQDTSFSISFWMKKDKKSSYSGHVLSKGTDHANDLEYQLIQDARELQLHLIDNTPTDGNGTHGVATYRTLANFLADNETDWEHITIVYDASTQLVTFYKDGANAYARPHSDADSDQDYDSMFKGGANLFIGQKAASGGTAAAQGFDGQLAHLAIFKHDGQSGRGSAVPTATQVLAAYNGGNVYDYNATAIHPKKADIVGYWKLNGTTATVGGTLTAGAGITTSVNSSLLTTEDVDMTFTFWFKKSAAESNSRTIVAKNNEYQIFVNGQILQFRMFDAHPSDGGAASYKTHYKTGFVADNTNWQHIVIKYDASTETATFILNGGTPTAAFLQLSADHDDFHDTTSQLTIGYSDFQTSQGFPGQVAQLAIFKHDGLSGRSSTILTDNEAKGLYNGGNVYDYTRHPKKDDLVGYWKLNQTVGNNVVVTDSSGEGNNGAMTGATSLTNPANSGLNEVKDNSFTVGFWMNKDNPSEATGLILVKSDEYNIRQIGRELRLVLVDATDMDSNSTGIVIATTTGNFLSNSSSSWEHIIVSYDAANRQVKFFINKVLHQTVNVTATEDADYNEMQDTTNVLRIGHTSDSFDGKLSNVIMFDHGAAGLPFDNEDAEELYSDGYVYDYNNHSRASDIVAWWKLDGNVNDSHTGGSHNGTVSGLAQTINSGLYEFEDQDFAIGFFVSPLDSTTLSVLDGDAASGITEREKITIEDILGTTIKYIVCDSNGAGAPSTGTALEVGDDTGAGTATEAGTAVTIDLTGTPDTQNAFLVQLKVAIESAAGHNGTITVSAVPAQAHGKQTIKLTNAHKTNIPTDTISQLAIGHPNTRYLFHKSNEYYMYYTNTILRVFMRDTTPKSLVGPNNPTSTVRNFSFNYSLPMNKFTHVVVSYDKSEEKMHLYINGVEQGSGNSPSSDPDYQESGGGQGIFYLGNYNTANTSDAELSHFVIFKGRHLTESEADELYNSGIGYSYTGHSRASDISAFYKLIDTTTTLVDSSGNGNNLTAVGVTVTNVTPTAKIDGHKKVPQLPLRMSVPGLSSLRTNPQK